MNSIINKLVNALGGILSSLDYRQPTRDFEKDLRQLDFELYHKALYTVSYQGKEFLVEPSHWKDGLLYFNLTPLDNNGSPLSGGRKETVEMGAFRELAEKAAKRIVYDLQLSEYHNDMAKAHAETIKAIETEIEKAEKRKRNQ